MITRKDFFKRQTTLSEIGTEGQERLQNAKVLVIGCGGLGSPIAVYLAASGIGSIHLVDFDEVSVSNLHRQVFYNVDNIGKSKAETLAKEISKKAPFSKVTFSKKAVEKSSILELIEQFDVVVDGTDSLPIKYLINDACVIKKKPLVYGSLYKFDGYVSTFNVITEEGFSCNLRDAFPKIATDIPNCEEAGTMNPIVGIIALMQSNEVVKLITNTGELLTNQLLIYNALENSQLKMKLRKNTSINIKDIFEKSSYLEVGCNVQDESLLISKEDFQKKILEKNIEVISVINEAVSLPFLVNHFLPFKKFKAQNFNPDLNKEYVVVCKRGITSYKAVVELKNKFPKLLINSLVDGVENF